MTIIRIIKYLHFHVMTKISIYIIIYTYIYIYRSTQYLSQTSSSTVTEFEIRYIYFPVVPLGQDDTERKTGNSQRYSTIGYIILVAIIGTTILVPYHYIKSLQLICGSGRRKCHFQRPNIQMRSIDLATWEHTRVVAPAMGLLPDT